MLLIVFVVEEFHCTLQTHRWKLRKGMDLDEVLDELKHFGKFQAINYLLLSVAILFAAMFEASFIFTAGDLDYR